MMNSLNESSGNLIVDSLFAFAFIEYRWLQMCTMWVIAVLIGCFVLIYTAFKVLQLKGALTVDYKELMSRRGFYFCVLVQALFKTSGVFYPLYPHEKMETLGPDKSEDRLDVISVFIPPEDENMLVTDCFMEANKLEEYKKSIAFVGDPDEVPPCFLCCYFNKPIVALGGSVYSRFRILGGVHISQEITIHQDMRSLVTEKFSVFCLSDEYRTTEKGIEAVVRAGVNDDNGLLVWEAKGVALSMRKGRRAKRKSGKIIRPVGNDIYKEEIIKTNKDTGIKFASATQDYQPQHLTPFTAKLVGFNAPIVHGLWSMAVAVNRIMANVDCYKDVYPMTISVCFKRPLTIPGQGLLQYSEPKGDNNHMDFKVIHPVTSAPILVGQMFTGKLRSGEE